MVLAGADQFEGSHFTTLLRYSGAYQRHKMILAFGQLDKLEFYKKQLLWQSLLVAILSTAARFDTSCIVGGRTSYIGDQSARKHYRTNTFYRVSTKERDTFKMIQKTNAAYLELHTYTSR
jgi:hypothetical protein